MEVFTSFIPHPVILMPVQYPVFHLDDLSERAQVAAHPYGVGRYLEKRAGMYTAELFEGVRDIHMGIDFFAPVGTSVYSFADGRLHLFGNNSAPGDYGYTLVVEYSMAERSLYALYGHLSAKSILNKRPGQSIARGEVIAWLGDTNENGGWISHLHFQISFVKPQRPDMPGVVTESALSQAIQDYPDPRTVLGPVY